MLFRSKPEDEETKAREKAATEKLMYDANHPNRGDFKTDEALLDKAYANQQPGISYDDRTRTMAVRGTSNMRDWWDDVSKIPAWGSIEDAQMFQNAQNECHKLIKSGKPVDRIVGHSLGASVAQAMSQKYDIPYSRTYAAPNLELVPHRFSAHHERYRNWTDWISILDRGAERSWPTQGFFAPARHSYRGYEGVYGLDA